MKKKISFILLLTITIIISIILIIYIANNNPFDSSEKYLAKYRIYNEDGWSEWYKDGETCGEKNKAIKAIEVAVRGDKKGNVLYNIYSEVDKFNDNDSYNGDTAGNLKSSIYGIRLSLSDELYKKFNIVYRTYNKKDGWLDWTTDYRISGDNGVDIEMIEIKVVSSSEKIKTSERSYIGEFK
ncbi:MAG: hypothetical protein IJJ47_10705 [Methanosphaera sp.]|nr:hypothetical protein [Methanosphaera sp.]